MGADFAVDLPSGWLYKWTNYIKGYRKRWFVLENGLFSYYSNANAVSHTCMGTIDLSNVTISVKSSSTSFTLREPSGRSYHLKALNDQDKTRWISALNASKSRIVKNNAESDSYSEDPFTPIPSDRSAADKSSTGKISQKLKRSGSSNWRAFRPFRRKSRPSVNTSQGSGGSTITATATAEITTASPMLGRQSKQQRKKHCQSPPKPEGATLVSNGVSVASAEGEYTSKPPIQFPYTTTSYSPYRRRSTLNAGLVNELRVHREFQDQLNAVDSAFDNMVVQVNTVLQSIGELTSKWKGNSIGSAAISTPLFKLKNLQNSTEELIETCQKTMAAWSLSIDWFQRRLAAEYDRTSRLERTVEQLAKQHRALETRLYSSYAPLSATRPTSASAVHRHLSPASLRSDQDLRGRSMSSMSEDLFFDAMSRTPSRMGDEEEVEEEHQLNPSFTSLSTGSLHHLDDESSDSEEDDLVTAAAEEGIIAVPGALRTSKPVRSNGTAEPGNKYEDTKISSDDFSDAIAQRRQRRTSIPPRPRISLNLWGVLKNCIGKELSRIPLPVNFNEPLSFLQRVTEDLTYSRCLDEAARATGDPVRRLAWVAAFSVSCYATTAVRMSKPFNPLLGETFECDRSDDDFGWRSFAEQVSHHPPVVAHYCESTRYGWKFWQEFTVNSKFRGKYLSLVPQGGTHLVFKDGQHFTWSKVTITVHNIIVGRLWAEIHGDTVIKDHNNKYNCRMHYEAHSYFSREPDRQVTGLIYDPDGKLVYKVSGTWDNQVSGCPVDSEGKPTSPSNVLVTVEPPNPNSESMYNFNKFAIELNEPEEGVAPTDSRLRPDQRLMEEGRWDEANAEKERLEVKQRRKRRAWDLYESGDAPLDPECGLPYKPVWFSPVHDTYMDEDCHEFNGTYWSAKAKQDWSKCPDIF